MGVLTLNITPAGVPLLGYRVKYRLVGGSTYTTVSPDPMTNPVIITGVDETEEYEGTVQTICAEDIFGPEQPFTVGPTTISGQLKINCAAKNCNSGGTASFNFVLDQPFNQPITIQIAEVWKIYSSDYGGQGGDMLPVGHPYKEAASYNFTCCGLACPPATITIPANTTNYLVTPGWPTTGYPDGTLACFGSCNPLNSGYDLKLFFKVTSPSGVILNLISGTTSTMTGDHFTIEYIN